MRAHVQFANMIHPLKSSLSPTVAHAYPNVPTISCTDISREDGNTGEIWQSAEVEEPSTDTLSSFYTSCPPTQQNARETATMVLILFVFQRELFGLLIRSVFQRGLFGLSQFD